MCNTKNKVHVNLLLLANDDPDVFYYFSFTTSGRKCNKKVAYKSMAALDRWS